MEFKQKYTKEQIAEIKEYAEDYYQWAIESAYMPIEKPPLPKPISIELQADIRNKLSPIKNLIAMIKIGRSKGFSSVNHLIEREINQAELSIEYLSFIPKNAQIDWPSEEDLIKQATAEYGIDTSYDYINGFNAAINYLKERMEKK